MSTLTPPALHPRYHFQNAAALPKPLSTFLPQFYQAWDADPTPSTTSKTPEYVTFYAPDAEFVFGPNPTVGRAAILALRNALVNRHTGPMVELRHTLETVYVPAGYDGAAGTGGDGDETEFEVMVRGRVWQKFINGKEVDGVFAALVNIVSNPRHQSQRQEVQGEETEREWLIQRYTVFADSAEVMAVIKELREAAP